MVDESLPTAAAARIDGPCQEFEAALNDGRRPQIEGYVEKAASVDRDLLRHELQRIHSQFEQIEKPGRADAAIRRPPQSETEPFRTTPSNGDQPQSQDETTSHSSPSGSAGESAPAVTSFDRYQVRGILGKGGFGVVFHGYDPELRRDVAIKAPISSSASSPAQVDAYLAEARIVAALDHPGIVPVYDVGRTGSRCFVVSKYVAGSDLAHWMARQRPDARRAAEIVAQVAEALQYAHQQGLVHRDIKPGNILIDDEGRPLVADFGLALCDASFGRGAAVCGTPAYMSPEQACGESHLVDARSDIYSLGAVFYELLSGRRPYRHTRSEDLIEEIARGEIRPPRQLDHGIPAELERICLKALAKRVGDRYTTAHDLADDLRRFLEESGPGIEKDPPADEIRISSGGGWRKLRLGLAASLLAACGAAWAANALLAEKPIVRFDALELQVSAVQASGALDGQQETYSLVNDGQNEAALPDERLTPDESFKLEGRFAAPCFWRLLWLDTSGRWSMALAPTLQQREFLYPLNRTMVTVHPEDPPGTHLLAIVAGSKPIGEELLGDLSATPPPQVERLLFWSNSKAAASRGPGREVGTIDSYLATLAGRLPADQKLVAALFLPTQP